MAFKSLNPDGGAAPPRNYNHSMEVPPNCRTLYVAGQIGMRPDGVVPAGVGPQSEICWQNVVTILRAHDMDVPDIVKVVQYLTRVADRNAHFEVRDRFLGAHKPTSTLLFVAALAQPEFVVEVEVVAARPV